MANQPQRVSPHAAPLSDAAVVATRPHLTCGYIHTTAAATLGPNGWHPPRCLYGACARPPALCHRSPPHQARTAL